MRHEWKDGYSTCQSHWATVNAPSEACFFTEGRRPVSFTVAIPLIVTHLQTQDRKITRMKVIYSFLCCFILLN